MAYTPGSSGGTPAPKYKRNKNKTKRDGSLNAAIGNAFAGSRYGSGNQSGASTSTRQARKPLRYVATAPGRRTNTVAAGAGSQRAGQSYQVKVDQAGNFFHVYGHGADAKRVPLSKATARAYGYTS